MYKTVPRIERPGTWQSLQKPQIHLNKLPIFCIASNSEDKQHSTATQTRDDVTIPFQFLPKGQLPPIKLQ